MPEIVEKRIDAEYLDFILSNRQLLSVSLVNDVFSNRCSGIDEIQAALPLTITQVRSRAKRIFVYLSNDSGDTWWITIAYGMTGGISETQTKHSHIEFQMSDCWFGFNTFYYTDVRRIASEVTLTCDPEVYRQKVTDVAKPLVFDGYGDDLFEPITRDEFVANIKKAGKKYVASAIMDQRSICSGVGNYLLSESFHRAKLHPRVRCNELTDEQATLLFKSICKAITVSYENGGMSMENYKHPDGTIGNQQNKCLVYGLKETTKGQRVYDEKGPHGRTIYTVFGQSE